MKKIIRYFAIIFIFVFSFIYTEKVSNIVKNRDPIMQDILNIKDKHLVESVNAIVEENTIIPGKTGCEIDVNKSYINMKNINKFNEKMIKYKDVVPSITINNIYDKYIGNGNKNISNISFVIYAKDKELIDKLNKIDNIKLNIFIDSELLKDGKIDIKNNKKIYNGGNNMVYDNVVLEWANNVIKEYNKSSYCINLNENDEYLKKCSKHKMHTIIPSIISSNIYNIKRDLSNGSIIYFDEKSIDKLNLINDYAINKGFKVVYLDELLDEGTCKNSE